MFIVSSLEGRRVSARYTNIATKSRVACGGEEAPVVEFMYHVFTCMPDESYCRRLRSVLLCLCDVFPALINFPCVLILLVLK